jgi:2-oxoglutarate dehydrogenase E2 component (dihydrolipoamide succinyltransferase)
MPTDVIMPQMGESIFEGTITRWLKKTGDTVEKDEPLFEISTDKVDAEIPSPVSGLLTEIKFHEGATVGVNTVVAVIGGALATSAPAAATAPAHASASTSASLAPLAALRLPDREIRSSPLVRRIAKDNNLDLNQIEGTGSDGRITKEDVLAHLAKTAPSSSAPIAQPAPSQVTMSKMRAIIAQRMVESVRISPHAHTVYRIDMTRIVRLREREKARFEAQHGVKLTYMPFIAAAAIQALAKLPIVNASLVDGIIHYHPNINLGIAVALEWGLIVPVVKRAETRNFPSLAAAIADFAARARSKKLLPEEVQDGTFTLTNSGVFGGEFGTPIINQPESAILAIGGLRKEPVVVTDADGNDSIAIRSMQHFCLGFDHRTIDGADAGKFMLEFQQALESWDKDIG